MPNNPELRKFIVAHFSDADLTILIADYFEPYKAEEKPGQAMVLRAQNLIEYCRRTGQLPNLEAALQKKHEHLYRTEFGALDVAPVEEKPRDPRQCFISHAHQDAGFAQRLADDLRAAGVPVWIAPDSIQPGELMVNAIDRGLDESGVFIAVLTPSASRSKWVRTETQVALQMWHSEELTIIPLMLEPCYAALLSNILATIQHINFVDDHDTGLKELKRRLGIAPPAAKPAREMEQTPRQRSRRSSPTKGDTSAAAPTVEDMPMCYVPPGDFIMGGDGPFDGKPEHPQKVAQGFWIGKYTVTNAQYAQFVADKGYARKKHWTEAIDAKRWEKGKFRGWNDEWREEPNQYREPFGLPNHPVVGLSWYEALAFTRWFQERLGIDSFGLPTETQWEYAARGPRFVPEAITTAITTMIRAAKALGGVNARALQDFTREIGQGILFDENRRTYPWGEGADPAKMNFSETGIGSTSAAGAFPAGMSLFGCEAMSGNVWEWTMTKMTGDYRDYDKKVDNQPDGSETARVLRGGAFDSIEDYARCARRNYNRPDLDDASIGFRVVASPIHL